jgi:hypothetical protein
VPQPALHEEEGEMVHEEEGQMVGRSEDQRSIQQGKRMDHSMHHHMGKKDSMHARKRDLTHAGKNEPKKAERHKVPPRAPLVPGLGLPALRKRGAGLVFDRTFQDEWSDYSTWGIDKRAEGEPEEVELESLEEPVKRRLGSEKRGGAGS